ncbi:MAG: glycosyltransferase family 2 protein [Blastocatellia bacterium]|nr:glycosyltransferase family 2 protein [Blastocatellia bacterium]
MLAQSQITEALIAQVVFVASMAMIVFTYAGYPALMFAISFILKRPVRREEITPQVSVIIAAYNEERDIEAKLKNTLALDYPRDRMEIIVASDCSTDQTDDIVRGFAAHGVILRRQSDRTGKTIAQNRAVKASSGAILIFSDATTMLEPDVIRKIVRNFADPEVGCVSGQLIYVNPSSSAVASGCRSYWSYEKFLKRCESRVGSLVGVSGCLYAARRICHARLAGDMIDDFAIATEIHLQGLRAVYEPEAIAFEGANRRARDEFRMRVRVIKQTLSALRRYRHTLNPFRHKMFAFQMIAHKALRYVIPFPLIAALIASGWASSSVVWLRFALIGQLVFYGGAIAGFIRERRKLRLGLLAIPYYFALTNVAALVAFLKAMQGETYVTWETVRDARNANPDHETAAHDIGRAPYIETTRIDTSNDIKTINGDRSEYRV